MTNLKKFTKLKREWVKLEAQLRTGSGRGWRDREPTPTLCTSVHLSEPTLPRYYGNPKLPCEKELGDLNALKVAF